ncbi:hypothetical protein HY333_00050 [Candidatus Collierbacteria bacterium]|nr:hypothetical protein [Candidatus Collierbacteria bacterium]
MLMLPLIISSSDPNTIKLYLKSHFSKYRLMYHLKPQTSSLTLTEAKDFSKACRLSTPDQIQSLYLIDQAELLTLPAQNALLKTLEELSSNQQVILTTNNHYRLLPTILSRCLLVKLTGEPLKTDPEVLASFLKAISSSPASSISLAAKMSEKDPLIELNHLIYYLRQENQVSPKRPLALILKQALVCLDDLHHNINTKLALEHFLFSCKHLNQKPS